MKDSKYKIQPVYFAFYFQSMLFNTESALISIKWISRLFEKLENGEINIDEVNLHTPLNHFQNIVLQAGSLSRYFWPSRDGHELRAEQLRTVFKVDDTSPLKSRDLRNHIEHFDEKLDEHFQKNVFGIFLPNYFGPDPSEEKIPHHLFRAYYTDTGIFKILGKRVAIEPLAKEILRIHDLLLRQTGGRHNE